ncbi:MAG: ABC transporter permease subunit [Planctomycetota bacterium]|nr:ABC transporter permease subunit [Planctomycetota bacterium]
MTDQKPFTGRTRQRRTRWGVATGEIASRTLITVGGIGTIVAVSTVFVFLLWVVVPLFLPAQMTPAREVPAAWIAADETDGAVLEFGVDEFQTTGWVLNSRGVVTSFEVETGRSLAEQDLELDSLLTSVASVPGYAVHYLAGEDGNVREADFGFATDFLLPEDVTEEARALTEDQVMLYETDDDIGMLQKTTQGQYRFQTLNVDVGDAMEFFTTPVRLLTASMPGNELILGAMSNDGELIVRRHAKRENILTGTSSWEEIDAATVTIEKRDGALPKNLLATGAGDQLFVIWEDGFLRRFNIRRLEAGLHVAEEVDLLPNANARLSHVDFILGQNTFIAADQNGDLRSWFNIRDAQAATSDKTTLVSAQTFPPTGSPVTAFAASSRSRIFAVGSHDGRITLYQATTGSQLATQSPSAESSASENKAPISHLLLTPKDDGVISIVGDRIARFVLDPRHPEATWTSIFRPLWYESYPEREHVWQSSGANQDLEPKLGLMPLIFGSLKATLYSMLIGAPLALLAAIYTSEFLTPSLRVKVKPTIELMASLPSVVLGFLAALVFAPFVETMISTIIAGAFSLPLCMLLGAFAWQLIPDQWSIALARWRLLFIALSIPCGILVAALMAPLVEKVVFAGDMHRWLDGQIGTGIGGWFLLFLPLCFAGMGLVTSRYINPWMRERSHRHLWSGKRFIMIDGVKFIVIAALGLLTSFALALVFHAVGWDPRGIFFGTYVQRNALVVGFVMGFAIIPIIYTIADDALAAVPEHLRSASLGAGATQWQTAVRIVVPAATSGLFSALMIGLGRAVGETMIVLMAGGNTPIMDWNVFNGFRTLSANIAVELPEAVRNSTHYRMLFLAALSLFVLTFIVNTIAEVVRIRFRRRIVEL